MIHLSSNKPAILLTLILCIGFTAAAQDVLQFRGPNKDSIYKGTINPAALKSGAKIIWETNVNKGYSAVSISGNKLFTMGNDRKNDIVWCLDINSGKVIWQYSYINGNSNYPGPRATPTIDGNSVYTLSSEGNIYSFDLNTGKVNWSKNIRKDFGAVSPTWHIAGSVAISGNTIVLNANKSGIALNKNTGALIWASSKGTGGYATPVFFKAGTVNAVALFGEKALYGVELATGRILWSFDWETGYDVNAADPLVFGDTIFIASGYSRGCALLKFTASSITKLWENTNISAHFTSPVYYNGLIYCINGNAGGRGPFRALDPADGKIVTESASRFGNFIFVDNYAVIITERAELSINSVSRTAITSTSNANLKSNVYWTMPVYSSGKLFIRNASGDLYCIDVK